MSHNSFVEYKCSLFQKKCSKAALCFNADHESFMTSKKMISSISIRKQPQNKTNNIKIKAKMLPDMLLSYV